MSDELPFRPATNPHDARLVAIGHSHAAVYALLMCWDRGDFGRAEALTCMVEILAAENARLRDALTRRARVEGMPVVILTRTATRAPEWSWRGEYFGWLWDCGCLIGAEMMLQATDAVCTRCSTPRPAGPPDDRRPVPLPADGKGWR